MNKIINHNTSANVDGNFYDELFCASNELGISEKKIFKDLIKMVITGSEIGKISGILTEYQDHSPARWENFYFALDEDEIENFTKARQYYKISVSKLAFIGFLLFWKILLFSYKERLRVKIIKIDFSSYDRYSAYFIKIKECFIKRMKIIQKE